MQGKIAPAEEQSHGVAMLKVSKQAKTSNKEVVVMKEFRVDKLPAS